MGERASAVSCGAPGAPAPAPAPPFSASLPVLNAALAWIAFSFIQLYTATCARRAGTSVAPHVRPTLALLLAVGCSLHSAPPSASFFTLDARGDEADLSRTGGRVSHSVASLPSFPGAGAATSMHLAHVTQAYDAAARTHACTSQAYHVPLAQAEPHRSACGRSGVGSGGAGHTPVQQNA